MATGLTRLTHKIAIQLHLVAVSCTVCSSHSRRPVRKLLDTHSNIVEQIFVWQEAFPEARRAGKGKHVPVL